MSREIGTLRALSNGESQYVGSSSGVFFINTVRRAFSAAAASTTRPNEQHEEQQGHPSPEDCILGGEQGPTGTLSDEPLGEPSGGPPDASSDLNMESPWNLAFLQELPEYSIGKHLVMSYFRIWHPLVPFLNGPDCLKDLDSLYAERRRLTSSQSLARLTIFRCIFGISSLDEPDLASWRCTPQQLMPVLGLVALKCDIISVQALLSAQVYFVATMALRNASTVGGIISKSIVQAGLHRCPYRYGHLSPDDRSMRKRVFWSAYVLDRFLSQSLGHPNGIQDSDIDVCLPGCRDLHEPVTNSVASPSSPNGADRLIHLPLNHPERHAASDRAHGSKGSSYTTEDDGGQDSDTADDADAQPTALVQHRQQVQAVLASHVRCSQLIGRMLEIFHKSIHVRDSDGRAVLFLKADLGAWGNNLDDPRTNRSSLSGLGPDPAVFPFISYHYSLLLVNRPSLSLDSDTAEFHTAIQACVTAGTTIIRTMEQKTNLGYPLFWPGYLSAVWMSGLVLAFAFQLKMHSAANATSGISSALKLLTVMGSRWRMALRCRSVLTTLLASIHSRAGQKRSRWEVDPLPSTRSTMRQTTAPDTNEARILRTGRSASSKRRSTGNRLRPHTRSQRGSLDTSELASHAASSPNEMPTPLATTHNISRTDSPSLPRWTNSAGPVFNGPGIATGDPYSVHGNSPYGYPNPYPFGQQAAAMGFPFASNARQHMMPIPTTFPDRRVNDLGANMMPGDGSVFDVFDGAAWGSLLDLVDNPGEEFF